MKRIIFIFILVVAATVLVSAQTAKRGPIVDKVYIDVRMSQEIGLKDAAEGKTDVFYEYVTGPTYSALPADTKVKLEAYTVPALTYSLLLNPIPNKAPYTWKVGEKTVFNPFAITEVRFALNFLISRKQIVDEILGGNGQPMFTMASPGQPGTYRYNLIASKFGFTVAGNEKKAIQDITNAIAEAAELTALKGKLVKGKEFWEFNGEPVTLRFYIRVDDPNMRLKEGRYIADQLQKAGLKVERVEVDRVKCSNAAYNDDPAKLELSMYTEAWSAGATRAWWDNVVSQMYARWGGYMPGGDNPDFWNYDNSEIDDLSKKAQNGQYVTANEYWDAALKATELGLAESVRIYLCQSKSYQVANKSRYLSRMAYGMGDGLNEWSLRTADVKPEKNGEKVLRMTLYSAKGSLFMSTWDPIGVDGFNDTYSLHISSPCYDPATFEAPNTALDTPLRVTWTNVQTKLAKDDAGNPVGQIPVPATAVLYDSASKSFKPVGAGKTAFSKATYTYKWGAWHNGRPIGIADVMYAQSFVVDWMTKDGEGDKYYDASYEGSARPFQETLKGIVLNSDGTITTYYNINHASPVRIAAQGAIWVNTYIAGHPVGVSWDIAEALAKMVAEGGKSGTAWSFSSDPAFVEVDVLSPKCLEDIKAKLQEFIAAKYLPAAIRKWKSADSAIADYTASIKFIEEHKNAYISNGSFFIANVDANANFVELDAFRNAAYPYLSTYWPTVLKSQNARIDGVTVPATVAKTKDALIDVAVSIVNYPAGTARSADATAKLRATLVQADGTEKAYPGTFVKAGLFQVKVPVADLSKLKAGSYTLVVESYLKDEAPAVEVTSLVVF
ncbi:MAG: ABC transporter substrate-binding protein [Spirochaetes bacterium]|nr:ABC transporter substrate-binding protein [Spirochaetota bacterium]